MPDSTTLIRVPTLVHARVRLMAEERNQTFGQVINHGLDLIESEQFWDEVSDLLPDDEYIQEFSAWDADYLE